MDSVGLIGGDPILEKYGYLNPSSAGPADNENIFLKLLVTQLENQNPLEPLENNEFIQQMSALASLQETQTLNANFANMIALQEIVAGQNAFTQSAALVGKYVEYVDPATGKSATGLVDSIHLNDGGLFLSIDGNDVPMNAVTGIVSAPDSDGAGDNSNNDSDGDGLPDDA